MRNQRIPHAMVVVDFTTLGLIVSSKTIMTLTSQAQLRGLTLSAVKLGK